MWPNGAGHPGDVNFCEQTGQGTPPNDWCEEKMACHEDPTKECEIKNWCVCQWAWEMYVKKLYQDPHEDETHRRVAGEGAA